MSNTHSTPPADKKTFAKVIFTFLMPTLIGKTCVVYFGLQYSQYPGHGYGYGLAFSVLFTVCSLLRFLWVNRHNEDL